MELFDGCVRILKICSLMYRKCDWFALQTKKRLQLELRPFPEYQFFYFYFLMWTELSALQLSCLQRESLL